MTKIIIGKTENGSRILKKHLPYVKEKDMKTATVGTRKRYPQ